MPPHPAPELPARSLAKPYKKPPASIPDEPREDVPTEDIAEQITLENEVEAASAVEDNTFIEEVDEESPDMMGIVASPEADDNVKE